MYKLYIDDMNKLKNGLKLFSELFVALPLTMVGLNIRLIERLKHVKTIADYEDSLTWPSSLIEDCTAFESWARQPDLVSTKGRLIVGSPMSS